MGNGNGAQLLHFPTLEVVTVQLDNRPTNNTFQFVSLPKEHCRERSLNRTLLLVRCFGGGLFRGWGGGG